MMASADDDRAALVALFHATDGNRWYEKNNWGTDAELATWHGVGVNDEGRVVKLTLHSNNLRGPIPSELGRLSALKELYLYRNQLSGPIPSELGRLSALETLALYRNQLSGHIPPQLRDLGALTHLYLDDNSLDGPIPPELGELTALKHLSLWSNQLTGPIPPEMGKLTALEGLYLQGNHLSGPLPKELGALSKLQTLWIDENKLTGPIPSELGNLSALRRLSLEENQLTGEIPPELGALAALRHLYLQNNLLSGSIPQELGDLRELRELRISSNRLTGPIPSELGRLSALKTLSLNLNQLSGPIPSELGHLSALKELKLWDNQLSGMGTGDAAESLLRVLLKPECAVDLNDNPWECPPAAVVAAGNASIRGYYDELKGCEEGPVEMRSLKIVLAGHSGAGKTSLIKTILAGSGTLVQGSELETVGVEISDYNLEGTATKFYDLAGQVDYYGLHQLFVTERTVYVMTWDASKFLRRKEELVEELMGWIATLHLRAPHSTVILLGTHSDKIHGGWYTRLLPRLRRAPSVASVMADVEEMLKTEHKAWKKKRGVRSDNGLVVEPGIVLASSSPTHSGPDSGVVELLQRLKGREGTTSFIPPSWSLALVVLDALKCRLDPLDALACWKNKEPLTVPHDTLKWVEAKKITEAWQRVQEELPDDQKAGDPSFAMESALNLREYGGSLLRVEEVVFLDVEALALRLAPVLNHKTSERDKWDGCPMFGGKRLEQPWQREATRNLVDRGILHHCFARFLWEKPEQEPEQRLPEASLDVLVKATFDVLVKLGVLLPLGRPYYYPLGKEYRWLTEEAEATGNHNCGRAHVSRGIPCGRGLLVLMRLPNQVPPVVARHLEAFAGLRKQWGLVSKWEFHGGVVPHGLVERVIASCHVIGDVVGGTCWRKGACFVGNDAGRRVSGGSYALMVDYQEKTGSENRPTAGTLTIRTYGVREERAVWGAMRFAISTVWRIFEEFPGLSWEAWFECPAHEWKSSHILQKPHWGDPILAPSSAPMCPCSAAATVAQNLGNCLSSWASLDDIFRCPAGQDGGTGAIANSEKAKKKAARGAEFTTALDEVWASCGRADHDMQRTEPEPRVFERVKSVAKDGSVGAALFLITFWEPISGMADRWVDGGSLGYTLPLTLVLAALPLVVLVLVSASLSRWFINRGRRWWLSHKHQE